MRHTPRWRVRHTPRFHMVLGVDFGKGRRDVAHKLRASYLAANLPPPREDAEDGICGVFQRPGMGKWHEGHLPSRREFCRTSCQERRIRIWPQPGQDVWAASEWMLPS